MKEKEIRPKKLFKKFLHLASIDIKKYFYKEKVSNNEKGFTEAEYIEINKKDEKDD